MIPDLIDKDIHALAEAFSKEWRTAPFGSFNLGPNAPWEITYRDNNNHFIVFYGAHPACAVGIYQSEVYVYKSICLSMDLSDETIFMLAIWLFASLQSDNKGDRFLYKLAIDFCHDKKDLNIIRRDITKFDPTVNNELFGFILDHIDSYLN